MVAVDTNILVYAHRADSDWHEPAERALRGLAESPAAWVIPRPCIHEFLSVVTQPRIWKTPTPLDLALEQAEMWMESPSLSLIDEGPLSWPVFKRVAHRARLRGAAVHDARIFAICLTSGATELWTADRDFSRFDGLRVCNPLIG